MLAKVKRKKKPEVCLFCFFGKSLKRVFKGWDIIEPVLDNLDGQMRDIESKIKDVKESSWEVFRLHHQRSRYIYEMFYKKQAISRELYTFCLREKIADENLIAKWKKTGYEKLCCLRCIQPKDTNYGTTCICRVPHKDVDANVIVECVNCGCKGERERFSSAFFW